MRHLGLPGWISYTGRDAARCIAPSGTNRSELHTAARAKAAGSATGHAAARALRATNATDAARHAQTFGDDGSRRAKIGHAAARAQTAAGTRLYAADANDTTHAADAGVRSAHRANKCHARGTDAAKPAPVH